MTIHIIDQVSRFHLLHFLLQNQNIFPIVVREFPLIDIPIAEQQRIVDEIRAEIDKQNEIKNQIATLRMEIDKIVESAAGLSEN